LAEKINKMTGNKNPIEYLPARAWDRSGKRFGSTAKAQRELGFKAKISLDEGLERTIRWTQENKELIKKNVLKHASLMQEKQ
jgi:nucleoside-diphosphate-sugar epimerase